MRLRLPQFYITELQTLHQKSPFIKSPPRSTKYYLVLLSTTQYYVVLRSTTTQYYLVLHSTT